MEFFETFTTSGVFNSGYATPPIVEILDKYDSLQQTQNKTTKELSDYYSPIAQLETNQQPIESFKLDKIISQEMKLPCVDYNPCKHGNCLLNNVTKEFSCDCHPGYMGPFCDIMKHPW